MDGGGWADRGRAVGRHEETAEVYTDILPVPTDPLSFLLICHSYPPVVGGSEIEAQRVCSAMIRRGHRVLVLCAGGDPMPEVRDWVDPEGVPVRILTRKSTGLWKDRWFALAVMRQLWRERKNYQCVYFLMQGLHLAAGMPVARLLKKPMCMKFGGSQVIPLLSQSAVGRIELSWLRRWAKRILILNPGMVQEAKDHGLPEDRLLWMPNPVDAAEFRPASEAERRMIRESLGIGQTTMVILYVGRLSPEKGLPPLLHAFAKVARQVAGATLVLLGDGPQRQELEKESVRLGIAGEQIRFAGRVPIQQVTRWLQAADVFSLLSPSEGFSCALEEAMAAGLPSVVTDIPANSQLVETDVHGVLVPVGDEQAAAAGFCRLLADTVLRRRMGEAARRRILDNYTMDHVCERYEALFREMTDSGK